MFSSVNLFLHASDVVRDVQTDIMDSKDTVPMIGDHIYNWDALSMISYVFGQLKSLHSCRRTNRERQIHCRSNLEAQRYCPHLFPS